MFSVLFQLEIVSHEPSSGDPRPVGLDDIHDQIAKSEASIKNISIPLQNALTISGIGAQLITGDWTDVLSRLAYGANPNLLI